MEQATANQHWFRSFNWRFKSMCMLVVEQYRGQSNKTITSILQVRSVFLYMKTYLKAKPWAYTRTPLFRTRLSRTPCYLEQKMISLRFAPVFSDIYYGLSRTRLSRTPRYLELFLAPLSSKQPHLSRTLIRPEEAPVNISVRKCSQGTSWQDVLKAEKCIDVFTVAQSDWLDLPLRQVAGIC